MAAIDGLVIGQRERVQVQPIEWRRANWESV
jgi:hypothetical protein